MTDRPTTGSGEATTARTGTASAREPLGVLATPSDIVDRACGVASQIADDVRTAAHSLLLDEQERAADAIHHIAEALHRTAQSLDHDRLPMAEATRRAAGHIDALGERVRHTGWQDLAVETEAFAQRQPALFLAGAMTLGFALGRMIADAAVDGERRRRGGE